MLTDRNIACPWDAVEIEIAPQNRQDQKVENVLTGKEKALTLCQKTITDQQAKPSSEGAAWECTESAECVQGCQYSLLASPERGYLRVESVIDATHERNLGSLTHSSFRRSTNSSATRFAEEPFRSASRRKQHSRDGKPLLDR